MKKNKQTPCCGLGVAFLGRKIFIFYRSRPEKKNFFLIGAGQDGFRFTPRKNKAKIKGEKINHCQNFRMTKLANAYFLTYRAREKNQTFLHGALSPDLVNWQKIGKIAAIKQTGMVIPRYRYQKKYVLYYGGRAIKAAFSPDLKKWSIQKKPILRLADNLTDNRRIEIGNILLADEGILLIYFLCPTKAAGENYSLQTALFDPKNPTRLLRQPEQALSAQTPEEKSPATPLGVIKRGNQLISYWQTREGRIYTLNHHYGGPETRQVHSTALLAKPRLNPIIKPITEHSWESKATFNPAAIYAEKRIHLLYRAIGDNDTSVLGYAASQDGFNIEERLNYPVYPRGAKEKITKTDSSQSASPLAYISGGGWNGGCEDPRLTVIGADVYMIYTSFDGWNSLRMALTSIKLKDFLQKKWPWQKPIFISPPNEIHKNWVLFPEKINGRFAILHSICPYILIDYFDNLNFDGQTYINSRYYGSNGRKKYWDNQMRGAGPPPIKTKKGWLLLYHAMDYRDPGKYKIGAMLLDLKNPSRVLYRTNQPILEPDRWYENQGWKSGVSYCCGAIVKNGQLFVYYGGADTVVCAARTRLDRLLMKLKNSRPINLEIL